MPPKGRFAVGAIIVTAAEAAAADCENRLPESEVLPKSAESRMSKLPRLSNRTRIAWQSVTMVAIAEKQKRLAHWLMSEAF